MNCDYVITISWNADHATLIPSMPKYLLTLHDSMRAHFCRNQEAFVDLLGLSRGHVALMNCCQKDTDALHIRLAKCYRHFMAAGGCIWQLSDENLPQRIGKGLAEMSQVRCLQQKVFRLLVSKMDIATLYGGDIQLHPPKAKPK